MSEFNTEKTGFTLDGRVMCTDDTCIGIVGTDGLCKECGLAYAGDEKPGKTPSDDAPAPVLQDDKPTDSREESAVFKNRLLLSIFLSLCYITLRMGKQNKTYVLL